MSQPLHNYLRTFRKRAGLSQEEVAFLIDASHNGQISRHEQGKWPPNLPAVLGYRVLFGRSVEKLFLGEFEVVEDAVRSRAESLLKVILADEVPSALRDQKEAFLRSLLSSKSFA